MKFRYILCFLCVTVLLITNCFAVDFNNDFFNIDTHMDIPECISYQINSLSEDDTYVLFYTYVDINYPYFVSGWGYQNGVIPSNSYVLLTNELGGGYGSSFDYSNNYSFNVQHVFYTNDNVNIISQKCAYDDKSISVPLENVVFIDSQNLNIVDETVDFKNMSVNQIFKFSQSNFVSNLKNYFYILVPIGILIIATFIGVIIIKKLL